MCCCPEPSINGQPNAYSWDGKTRSTRPPNPPDLQDGDTLVYDEPGRCGGLDCHSHHFRLVRQGPDFKLQVGGGRFAILVRHGSGDERIEISCGNVMLRPLATLDSNGRYWLLHALYSVQRDAAERAQMQTTGRWMNAFLDKRIKIRRKNHQRWAEIIPESEDA